MFSFILGAGGLALDALGFGLRMGTYKREMSELAAQRSEQEFASMRQQEKVMSMATSVLAANAVRGAAFGQNPLSMQALTLRTLKKEGEALSDIKSNERMGRINMLEKASILKSESEFSMVGSLARLGNRAWNISSSLADTPNNFQGWSDFMQKAFSREDNDE